MIRTTMPIGVLDDAVLSPPLVRDHPLPCTDEPDPIRPLTVVVCPKPEPVARAPQMPRFKRPLPEPPPKKEKQWPAPKPGTVVEWGRVRKRLGITSEIEGCILNSRKFQPVLAAMEQAAVALRQSGLSYVEISRLFRRPHSTFITAVKRVEAREQAPVDDRRLDNLSTPVHNVSQSVGDRRLVLQTA